MFFGFIVRLLDVFLEGYVDTITYVYRVGASLKCSIYYSFIFVDKKIYIYSNSSTETDLVIYMFLVY